MKQDRCKPDSVVFDPRYYKTDTIVPKGARDERGRFKKPEIRFKRCGKKEAEFACVTDFLPMRFKLKGSRFTRLEEKQ